MSTLNIKIIGEVTKVEKPNKDPSKPPYNFVNVVYKTEEGKMEARDIPAWTEVGKVLEDAKVNDTYSIEREKNGMYWNWIGISRQDSFNEDKVQPKTFSKPQYETAEERNARQVLIVRQSSLSTAVSVCTVAGTVVSAEDVIKVAKRFEQFVFSGE